MQYNSIKTKLALALMGCCFIIISILVVNNTVTVRKQAFKAAKENALALARDHAGQIEAVLEAALDSARTLAQAFSAVKDPDLSLDIGRDPANAILQRLLLSNQSSFAIYTLWEPEAFDQMDMAYKGIKGHDDTGRFIPYWTRSSEGAAVVGPAVGYEKEGLGDFYLIPKKTKKAALIDPRPCLMHGKEMTLISLAAPIIYNEVFYGIVGIDMTTDRFQKIVSKDIHYGGAAQIVLISNNGSIAASYPNKTIINTHMREFDVDFDEHYKGVRDGNEVLVSGEDGLLEVYVPLIIGNIDSLWSVNIRIPWDLITAEATSQMWKQISIGAALAVLAVLIAVFISGRIVRPIQTLSAGAKRVAAGDLDHVIEVRSKNEIGELTASFNAMIRSLRQTRQENQIQNWYKTGLTQLNEHMRGDQDMAELGRSTITFLAKYLDAKIGAIYLKNDHNDLKLVGSYAYKKRKNISNTFGLGEALVGQAALEKESILLANVPEDYIMVSSGLGEAVPRNILVLPFMHNGDVKGIVELGSLGEFSDTDLNFLNQVSESIAIAFHSAESRHKVQRLLEQTRIQAKELETQQEDLRASNQELEEQREELRSTNEELESQSEELRASNEELEEKTEVLESQKEAIEKRRQQVEGVKQGVEEKGREQVLLCR